MKKKDLKEKIRLIQLHYDEIKKQRDVLLTYLGHINSFFFATKDEELEIRDYMFRTNVELISEHVLEFFNETYEKIPVNEHNIEEFLTKWKKLLVEKNPPIIEKLKEMRKKTSDDGANIYG